MPNPPRRPHRRWMLLAVLPLVGGLPSPGLATPPEMASHPGIVYSSHDNRPAPLGSLRFWMLQHKKVWFRLEGLSLVQPGTLQFSYRGRPIRHWRDGSGGPGGQQAGAMSPILWGDRLAWGHGVGPEGTNLYLYIWTRWSWLHPAASSHPEWFTVQRKRRLRAGQG